uniref:Uncharacterized protein n=1 Tax=Arundo donax TaxID=35708 RepID=A0A0A9HVN3_ARUDO
MELLPPEMRLAELGLDLLGCRRLAAVAPVAPRPSKEPPPDPRRHPGQRRRPLLRRRYLQRHRLRHPHSADARSP